MSTIAGVSIPQIRKAEKRRVKLKVAVAGPSGSGKTYGALVLAKNLWPDAKVCAIDTENESASLYADDFEFDTIPLGPPFTSERYEACIEAAVHAGYDVLIIDSISHQWDGEGGILRRKEELDQRPGSNSYTNWSKFTPEHQGFIEAIKQAPIHIIATMRAKQDYILESNDKGKSKPVKVGLAPVQREGFDYEFSLVFDVQMDHKASATKDRTGLFNGKIVNLADKKVADQIRNWLESGKESPEQDRANWTAQPATQERASAPQSRPSPQPPQQSAPKTNGKPTAAKVAEWHLEQDMLSCHVYDSVKRPGKRGEFVAVKHNGNVHGKDLAYCFHENLFEALLLAKGNRARLQVALENDFVTITDVIQVADQEFRDGRPYTPPPADTPEIPPTENIHGVAVTDDDLPF